MVLLGFQLYSWVDSPQLQGKTLAALATAGVDHGPATRRRHAGTKPVDTHTLDV